MMQFKPAKNGTYPNFLKNNAQKNNTYIFLSLFIIDQASN